MPNSKDPLIPSLHLPHHLHAIRDARRHGFLAEYVVALLGELGDKGSVKIVLSKHHFSIAFVGQEETHQDANENGISDPTLRQEIAVV